MHIRHARRALGKFLQPRFTWRGGGRLDVDEAAVQTQKGRESHMAAAPVPASRADAEEKESRSVWHVRISVP